MDLPIEQDALKDLSAQDPPPTPHTHEVSSFVATPRELGLLEKAAKWWNSALGPGVHITRKDGSALRLMTIVTSNSYEDREGETITSAALKAYEDSCYPGEDLFHCDNPLLWWHDDDIVMGEIIGVSYSEPFLIEVARELPNPVSKVLFDYAERNGHNAGASHRFGYLAKDRDPDGTFHQIFKQETSYLPERSLAANDKTYAGVIMASPQSDKRINEIFEPLGIKDAAAKFHAKTGEIAKELEALGISHKALPPKVVDPKPAVVEGEDVIEEEVEEDVKDGPEMDIASFSAIVNNIAGLVMDLVESQSGMLDNQLGMAKELTEIKEMRVSEKAQDSTTMKDLQDKVKALSEQVAALNQRASLAPRSASREIASADPELAKKQISEAIDGAGEARKEQSKKVDPFWGELNDLPT